VYELSNTTEQLAINTIRTLAIDSIEKANSGHPGMPMGAAPMAYALWANHMKHNPANPEWFNRDRFVLSAGHGSALLYSLLHLFGYGLTIEDLKQFRQWGSKTPGHPEYKHTPGVEATTGPLGQGIAMSVGIAMAESHLAATYNKENFNIVDHYTYSICGDGDLMEGVASEAASLAGHLGLGKLIVLYDSNDISLDGDLHMSFSENVQRRFEAYGWQVLYVEDGNNVDEINRALEEAKNDLEHPTLIEVKTVIGYGAPNKSGKSAVHGAPLGEEERTLTRETYQWTYEEDFHVPDEARKHYETLSESGKVYEANWSELFSKYETQYPELASQLQDAIQQVLPENWDQEIPTYTPGKDKLATRASSGQVLNAIAKNVPSIIGGSADLAGSNNTLLKNEENFSRKNYKGRNIWFGVREFAMASALNGMALHGGLKVYGGTFFVFSDYLRPAVRLSALMGLPVTYVLTHDSVAVGEDGPTHEPVEQLAAFRAMPGLSVVRPADGNEAAAAWKLAIESKDRPTMLVLTRQALPTIEGSIEKAEEGIKKGAYVLSEAETDTPDILLLATGSEVSLAVEAQKVLQKENIHASVVSMPAWDRFEAQPQSYKEQVLPKTVKKRLGIEMGSSFGWAKYVGDEGDVIAIDQFGASAPGEKILEEYGFTVENVVAKAKALINK
jgi:transketolase